MGSIKRLLREILSERKLLLFGSLALFAGAALSLTLPAVVRFFLQEQNLHLLTDRPIIPAVSVVILFAVQAWLFFWRAKLFGVLGQRVVARVREKLFVGILQKPISFFDSSPTGELVSRLTADTALLQDLVGIKVSVILRYSVQVICGIVLMVYISPLLSSVLLAALPVLVLISIFLARALKKKSKETQAALAEGATVAEESFSLIRIVRSFSQVRSGLGNLQNLRRNFYVLVRNGP